MNGLKTWEQLLPQRAEDVWPNSRWRRSLIAHASGGQFIAQFGPPAQARSQANRHAKEVEHRRTPCLTRSGIKERAGRPLRVLPQHAGTGAHGTSSRDDATQRGQVGGHCRCRA
jgi:hypothetical protein